MEGFAPAPDARLDHPYFARPAPCTMLIDEVEAIWAPIAEADDWSAFHAKLAAIAEMARGLRHHARAAPRAGGRAGLRRPC